MLRTDRSPPPVPDGTANGGPRRDRIDAIRSIPRERETRQLCRHTFSDPGVRPIRVALIEMSPMLHGVLSQLLASQTDIEVVPAPVIDEATTMGAADVLIIARAGATAHDAEAMLFAQPRSAVFRIADRGRHTFLHTLRPTELALGSVSAEELIDAIRRTARPGDSVG